MLQHRLCVLGLVTCRKSERDMWWLLRWLLWWLWLWLSAIQWLSLEAAQLRIFQYSVQQTRCCQGNHWREEWPQFPRCPATPNDPPPGNERKLWQPRWKWSAMRRSKMVQVKVTKSKSSSTSSWTSSTMVPSWLPVGSSPSSSSLPWKFAVKTKTPKTFC